MITGHRPLSRAVPSYRPAVTTRLRPRLRHILFGTVLLAFVLLFVMRAQVAAGMADAWVLDEAPRQSDAILFLSGGDGVNRAQEAARLYREGYAPQVIGTNIYIDPSLVSSRNSLAAAVLENGGVPQSDQDWLVAGVDSTYDEAVAALGWVRSHRARRLIVVTGPFHTRRTKWIFDRIMAPLHVQVTVVAAPTRTYSVSRWWQSEFGVISFQNELIKYLYYKYKY